jgi:hypothetical protein
MGQFEFLAWIMLGSMPVYLVMLIGFLMCVRSYRDRPTASILTGVAILLLTGVRLTVTIMSILFQTTLSEIVEPHLQIFFAALADAIPAAAAWGLLLWVIFMVKEPRQYPELPP